MSKKYWLFKTEPDCFSLDNLKASPKGVACWDGVRNYQARNFLRDDIRKGDSVLIHYSSITIPGLAGIADVVRSGYPDHTAADLKSDHPDPKHTDKNPIWYMVDVKFKHKFDEIISIKELRSVPGLEEMMLVQRGSRLSIQPVTPKEWAIIATLADSGT